MKKTSLAALFAALLTVAPLAFADTIDFVGMTGVSNGSVYVGPYSLTDNGVSILGTCITFNLEVGPPYEWTASLEGLGDFTDPMYTELLEAEWLNLKFSSNTDWVGIHQAIWDLFGASYNDVDTKGWVSQAKVAANWSSVDPTSFGVLVPQPENATQWFLVTDSKSAPEPSLFFLAGGGLLCMLAKMRKARVNLASAWGVAVKWQSARPPRRI